MSKKILIFTLAFIFLLFIGCQDRAKDIVESIDIATTSATIEDYDELCELQTQYDNLTEHEKKKVINYSNLVSTINSIEEEKATIEANEFNILIDKAIVDISEDNYENLCNLKKEYDGMDSQIKEKVTSYNKLDEAIEASDIISEANSLYEQKKYKESLKRYNDIKFSSMYYDVARQKIYSKGLKLYKNKDYANAKYYFSNDYKDGDKYYYISKTLDDYNNKKDVDLDSALLTIQSYADDGFDSAKEILEEEPFVSYNSLYKLNGLYRSQNKFTRVMIGTAEVTYISYDLYCYINFDNGEITSNSFMVDVEDVTSNLVKNRASRRNYDCRCTCVDNGIYECNVIYNDIIEDYKTIGYSFKLQINSDGTISCTLNATTEDEKNVSFTEGKYLKIN